jgi:hypothetical protein
VATTSLIPPLPHTVGGHIDDNESRSDMEPKHVQIEKRLDRRRPFAT